jgi:hypothetical protein
MKRTLCAAAAIAGLLFANITLAQNTSDTSDAKKKKDHGVDELSISNRGVTITKKNKEVRAADSLRKENRKFKMSYCLVDLGLNLISDNTNYADPAVKNLLNVPANRQNKSLFDLRTGKSVNVNIYPWMIRYKALKTKGQRIYVSSGIGLQLYNFRYEDPINFNRNPVSVSLDTISFKKNKLALDYLNVPLMLTMKTKLHKDTWLVYGAGITEGFRIDSWTKQVSGQRGKVKESDQFGLADFNTCLSAEIGIEGVFRLFATYQVTNMFQNALEQHPICIGFRFGGI